MIDLDDYPVVTENSESFLNHRQLLDYRSEREDCLQWLLILVAVILLLTSLCYLRRQTLSAWILNSSFHVLTATSITYGKEPDKAERYAKGTVKLPEEPNIYRNQNKNTMSYLKHQTKA